MTKYFLIFFAFFAFSCSNSTQPDEQKLGNVNFSSPKVGQNSNYQKAFGQNYSDKSINSYDLLNTFLNIEITQIKSDTIFIKESLQDSTEQNYAIIMRNDSLVIFRPKSRFLSSHLFGDHFINYRIPLTVDQTNEIQFLNWKTATRYCECFITGYTINFQSVDSIYDSLHAVVDETAMAADKYGFNFLFSQEQGIVLSTRITSWQNSGIVWFLTSNK